MSTRALIAKKTAHGFAGIYLNHSDKTTLKTLRDFYGTEEQVDRLFCLGNLSTLGSKMNPDPTWLHSFDHPQANVTIAYERDRNESGQQSKMCATFSRLRENIGATDNTYIFADGKWVASGASIEGGIDFDGAAPSLILTETTATQENPGRADQLNPEVIENILNAAARVAEQTEWIIEKLQRVGDREIAVQALRYLQTACYG